MKIFIGCSKSEKIPKKYFEDSQKLFEEILKDNDMVFRAKNEGIMGLAYRTAKKYNRKITAMTSTFYEDELKKLSCDEAILTDTMLESTLKIYEACDVVIFLPGGYGTVYELFTAIQSYLGGEIKQKIILYNCAGYYDKLISFLESAYKDGFILEEDYDSLVILNSVSEVVDYIKNISLDSE